jgi:hypothetical protein
MIFCIALLYTIIDEKVRIGTLRIGARKHTWGERNEDHT